MTDLLTFFRRPSLPAHLEYPVIEPVSQNTPRPFWSVMIPTYNRLTYLAQTLESVLLQDPGPAEMQIEVVDNASSQDVEELVHRVGRGRINFYRQSQNVGMSANWTTCVQRAHGHWIHILHDDDLLFPRFYQTYQQFIEDHPEVKMMFCRVLAIDEHGEWQQVLSSPPHQSFSGIVPSCLENLAQTNFIVAPTVVVTRHIYEQLGGFMSCLSYAPDWEMWLRIVDIAQVGYIHHPFLQYRIHSESGTNQFLTSTKNIAELLLIIEAGIHKLPTSLQKQIRYKSYKCHAEYANILRNKFHQEGQHRVALKYALWMLRLHPWGRNPLRFSKSVFKALHKG
ncbi:MAG: glycosyltransferase [Chitinivibrionales bacterium]|nr:glycosyltransferase [Chitinivibrionales bacterium]